MKALNTKATEIFLKLIGLTDNEDGYVKIQNNESFMPVSVEKLHTCAIFDTEGVFYSIAHYGEQNGDLMADPEMIFISVPKHKKVFPTYFKNAYLEIERESLFLDVNGVWQIWKQEQEGEAEFANQWMLNIQDQQKL